MMLTGSDHRDQLTRPGSLAGSGSGYCGGRPPLAGPSACGLRLNAAPRACGLRLRLRRKPARDSVTEAATKPWPGRGPGRRGAGGLVSASHGFD